MKKYGLNFCRGIYMDATLCDIFTIRPTKALVTILLLVAMMSRTTAAPSPSILGMNLPDHREVSSSVYSNACGRSHEVVVSNKIKSHPPLAIVSEQLKSTLIAFNELNKTKLLTLYKLKIDEVKHNEVHDLPQKQFLEFANYVKKYPKKSSGMLLSHFLPKLHKNLLLYWEAFEKLSKLIPNMESSHNLDDRMSVHSKMKVIIQLLVCEVETSLNVTNKVIRHPELRHNKIGKEWSTEPNLKDLYNLDASTLLYFKKFITEWITITNRIGGKGVKKVRKTKSKGRTTRTKGKQRPTKRRLLKKQLS